MRIYFILRIIIKRHSLISGCPGNPGVVRNYYTGMPKCYRSFNVYTSSCAHLNLSSYLVMSFVTSPIFLCIPISPTQVAFVCLIFSFFLYDNTNDHPQVLHTTEGQDLVNRQLVSLPFLCRQRGKSSDHCRGDVWSTRRIP